MVHLAILLYALIFIYIKLLKIKMFLLNHKIWVKTHMEFRKEIYLLKYQFK